MLTARSSGGRARQNGLSLVEVAVAATVLLCVTTGSMSLIVAVKRRSADSEHQAAASALALEIVERMRLNRAAALAGDYDSPAAAQATPALPSVAQADLKDWRTQLTHSLPAGAGRIATQAVSGVVWVSVTLQWQRPGDAAAASTAQQSFSFRL